MPPLSAGTATRAITPPPELQPGYLAGFQPGNRLSEGVHDDLHARALALSDGTTTVVLAALDLIGYTQGETRPLRTQIGEADEAHIILAATHTHSGPDTIGLWGPSLLESGVSEAYMAFLRGRVREAILAAIADLAPAELTAAAGRLPDGLLKNIRVPDLLDREISVLRAQRPDGSTIATLVHFAAHPEILVYDNRLISSDFPHYLRDRVEAELGGSALFLNGALGGMVTPDVSANTFAEAERVGHAAAEAALSALKAAQPVSRADIVAGRAFVHIPPENELLKAAVAMGIIKADVTTEGDFRAEVHHLRIGEAAEIVTLPGEAFPSVGLRLKESMAAPVRFVIGLANDELGYMMPPEDYGKDLYSLERRSCVGPLAAERCQAALQELMARAR